MTDINSTATDDDHEVIWLAPWCDACQAVCADDVGRTWCQDAVYDPCEECGREPVKFVRADLNRAATISFTDDELYHLFIAMDDRARAFRGTREDVNVLREKLLPVYRDWHAAHPHKVHPTAMTSGQ
jgi:hypothetical protein